jgi:hypothetical protein
MIFLFYSLKYIPMSSQENTTVLADHNKISLPEKGIILDWIEADIKAQKVQNQVVLTSSAIRVWLWTWPFIQLVDPAAAIAELESMRAANDNQNTSLKAA